MDIKSVNSTSVYSTQQEINDKKPLNTAEKQEANAASLKADKLEISDEAKLSSMLENPEIRDRIKSGFYDNPDVLEEVAFRLSQDIPVEEAE